jgi:2-iminobutanoate/2-iminopropanoate deaminase
MEIIKSKEAPDPIGPYNQAIKANNMLFVSGQIAINQRTGELVTDNIVDETGRVMENLKHVLTEAGLTFNNVVKCTIFLRDMADFTEVNKVYGSYFTGNSPARETVAVVGLPKNVNVEISCIACYQD